MEGEINKDIEEENDIEKVVDHMMEGVPEEDKHDFKKMVAMSMQMGMVSSPGAELMKKMTPENVSEFIRAEERSDERKLKKDSYAMILKAFFALLAAIFVLIIIYMLKGQPDLLEKVIPPLITLVAGALGGYGVGKSQRDDS